MHTSRIALVSGANRGLGLETSRQLARRGIIVLMGARDMERGHQATEALKKQGLPVEAIQLDVTRSDHIAGVKRRVEQGYGKLDILVNNAGMVHPEERGHVNTAAWVSLPALKATFDVNFFGHVALTQTLLPLLESSQGGRIVNVSSILGSLTLQSDTSAEATQIKHLAYDASKAALNQFTIHLAAALKDTAIKVNAAHPGWVKTALGSRRAPMDVETGAQTAVWLATLDARGPTGQFFHLEQVIPW